MSDNEEYKAVVANITFRTPLCKAFIEALFSKILQKVEAFSDITWMPLTSLEELQKQRREASE